MIALLLYLAAVLAPLAWLWRRAVRGRPRLRDEMFPMQPYRRRPGPAVWHRDFKPQNRAERRARARALQRIDRRGPPEPPRNGRHLGLEW
jgi:hypothetical protein